MKLKDALADAKQILVNTYPLQGRQAPIKISKSYFRRELRSYYSNYMIVEGERADPDCTESEVVWYEEGGMRPILATYYPLTKYLLLGN